MNLKLARITLKRPKTPRKHKYRRSKSFFIKFLSHISNCCVQSLHFTIGHFTVMDGSEGEGDLVLIQTFFALLWKLFLKNTSKHKNNLIYIIMQEGLYQNKLTVSLASIHNCKWPICQKKLLRNVKASK